MTRLVVSLVHKPYAVCRDLHSFPTRRSSDLPSAIPSWSADGSRLTYTRYGPFEQVRYYDFTSGTFTDVTNGFQSAFDARLDRKSTRLNSSHLVISYAVFCLKKTKKAPKTSQN